MTKYTLKQKNLNIKQKKYLTTFKLNLKLCEKNVHKRKKAKEHRKLFTTLKAMSTRSRPCSCPSQQQLAIFADKQY